MRLGTEVANLPQDGQSGRSVSGGKRAFGVGVRPERKIL